MYRYVSKETLVKIEQMFRNVSKDRTNVQRNVSKDRTNVQKRK